MRTTTLLLTAVFTAAGIATSVAQIYSVNAVGYVNITVPCSADQTKGAIIANPLNGTNNSLNTIIPLDSAYAGTLIFRFDPATQNYFDSIQFVDGFGWFSASADPNILNVNPGEAFWIYPVHASATTLNLTFVGEVPQGTLNNPLPTVGGRLAMKSSVVPQAAPIGTTGDTATLQFPAEPGDLLFLFDSAAQTYKDSYQYVDGFGWFSANSDDPGPQGPTIAVAAGFFLVMDPAATANNWQRVFSVNP